MKELTPNEYKKILLDVLADFHSVCEKNGFRYTLAFGTLLGAVRHKGFIPWDDDIDVLMPREDYEKLLLVANADLKRNHRMISIETEKDFGAPLAKIIDTTTVLNQYNHAAESIDLGIYIDVFVFDSVPDDESKKQKVYRRSVFLQRCWTFCEYRPDENDNVVRRGLKKLVNRTSWTRFFSFRLRNNAVSINTDGELYSMLMFGQSYNREIYELPKRQFDNLIYLDFEQYRFKAIPDYDNYLRKRYGDYMQLPPKEERVGKHSMKVYLK